ncbi:uncharacterized protein LOC135341935 isoform X3 [Halichondria panicea]|uniref:uncharacterized protein LOC135341935 isoform X3 n=1 Tax=Halichondria panicea TaxID=6063 RepID=UPI00312B7304
MAALETTDFTSSAEELVDAQFTDRTETLDIIHVLTRDFLQAVAQGDNPQLSITSRSEKNVVRDENRRLRLGKIKVTKKLFVKNGTGAERYAKIWQVLSLVQKLLLEGKVATQREAYYCLVQHFKNQSEFNDTLQDVVALTGCARSSLGICASSSGAIAGRVQWLEGGETIDCSATTGGKLIPGVIEGVRFESLGARYILVVEKDAVFTYLCGQRIWDSLPLVLVTGCGYPPLSVRAILKQLQTQLQLPVVGLFDYNPHGVRILLTYKYGSTRMGLEAHSYAVDIKWLGVHHSDLFDPSTGSVCVERSALQQWSSADERVFNSVASRVEVIQCPHYQREMGLMRRARVKAEIEALNSRGFDTLEFKIVQKILRKNYF